MIYQTHVQIAETIYKELDAFSSTYLSKREFIKGSNHPDYDLYYRFIKHHYEGSIAVVRELLIEVTSKKMSRYERGFKMGIIAHFLADYMCSYHSNPNYNRKNLATHIRYEQKLYKETKDFSLFDKIMFGPGKAANAGGVFVSALEIEQNRTFHQWHPDVVNQKLKDLMKQLFHDMYV